MLLGEIHSFGLQVLPKLPCERNVGTTRDESFDEQRFETSLFFALLRFADADSGRSRSRFRTDGDQRSEVMAITIPA